MYELGVVATATKKLYCPAAGSAGSLQGGGEVCPWGRGGCRMAGKVFKHLGPHSRVAVRGPEWLPPRVSPDVWHRGPFVAAPCVPLCSALSEDAHQAHLGKIVTWGPVSTGIFVLMEAEVMVQGDGGIKGHGGRAAPHQEEWFCIQFQFHVTACDSVKQIYNVLVYVKFYIEWQCPRCWYHLFQLWILLDSAATDTLPLGWSCGACCPIAMITSPPPPTQGRARNKKTIILRLLISILPPIAQSQVG